MRTITAPLQMVDLKTQYLRLKPELDAAVLEVLESTRYIGGPKVESFARHLAEYLGVRHVIPCANGTDALQIALMALGLRPGDEVIVPAFTYVATAEVLALLGLRPVMVDVDPHTFNITAEHIERAVTPRTRAIVPVHLFGQSVDMLPVLALAKQHKLFVIEDNAQAIGAAYIFPNSAREKTGTMGQVGCTSFFPSKNLGCYGDGGAMMTNDDGLADQLRMVANHGQKRLYYHDAVGVNSRLDAIQSVILDLKLRHLDEYNAARVRAADYYDAAFRDVPALQTPVRDPNSTHVFHQYTLQVRHGNRDALQKFLAEKGVPSMIYYPVPLYKQGAYAEYWPGGELPVTEKLCNSVISLPMHTELDENTLEFIVENVKSFFKK